MRLPQARSKLDHREESVIARRHVQFMWHQSWYFMILQIERVWPNTSMRDRKVYSNNLTGHKSKKFVR